MSRLQKYEFRCPFGSCGKMYTRAEYVRRHATRAHNCTLSSDQIARLPIGKAETNENQRSPIVIPPLKQETGKVGKLPGNNAYKMAIPLKPNSEPDWARSPTHFPTTPAPSRVNVCNAPVTPPVSALNPGVSVVPGVIEPMKVMESKKVAQPANAVQSIKAAEPMKAVEPRQAINPLAPPFFDPNVANSGSTGPVPVPMAAFRHAVNTACDNPQAMEYAGDVTVTQYEPVPMADQLAPENDPFLLVLQYKEMVAELQRENANLKTEICSLFRNVNHIRQILNS